MLRRLATPILMVSALLFIVAPPSWADDLVEVESDGAVGGSAEVVLTPRDPGEGSNNEDGGSGTATISVKTPGKSTCTHLGEKIDCSSSFGVWSQAKECWVQRVSPQPREDDPIWSGHDDGAIYWCTPPHTSGVTIGGRHMFWAPSGDAAGAPVLVDPVTLAEEAIERMRLVAPRIGMTPLDPEAPLLVGVDAWLWLDDRGPRGYGPITRSASAGSVSVRATAKVTKVVWDMGDGTRFTCRSAGTEWTPERGTGPSPTCGHTYELPSTGVGDGTYTVRATAHWRVDWTGAGQSGRITFTLTGARPVTVTELQVLQTG